jgi:flagellar hook protein FlgE
MLQSIYAGVSSLQSFQTGIDVLANNIANVNTIGFKGSSTEFSNLYAKEISTSGNAVTSTQSGLGVRVSATALDISKGEYYRTGNVTDLAINGDDGWFGLIGNSDDTYFTRAGNFSFDPYTLDGTPADTGEFPFYPYGEFSGDVRLMNEEGFFVTGTVANNTTDGILSPIVETLELNLADVAAQDALTFPGQLTYPVQPTTQADFFGNLGTENIPRVVSAEVISPQSERNSLRLYFTQSAVQPATGISWDVLATTQTADGSVVYDTQTGVVTFDGNGALANSTLGTLDNNGAPVTANMRSGFSGLISNDGPTQATSVTVDGILQGDLVNYTVNRNGEVISTFTNGRQSVVGKVAIYHFQNDQGLEAISGNKFRASVNSGQPIFYAQDNGEILTSTLENSNVTLDRALTELIIMQRSYDAASKTISTGDEMLKNALQM